MSVFTPVGRAELEAWLGRYDVGALRDFQPIATGIENTNYFVDSAAGRHVLTLFERLDAADADVYLALQAHLGGHGIPCPVPLTDRHGARLGRLHGKPAALVSRLAGASVTRPDAGQCAAAGRLLARLHRAGADFPRPLTNPRGPRWWREAAGRLAGRLEAADARLLDEELRHQALYRLKDVPRGMIHADLFRDNVLFDGGEISGVLDFYFAGHDAWLYDLAIAANDWCAEGAELDPLRLAALLRGYHAERPLSAIERGAWPVLLRAAALRFWLSRLLDQHFPRPGEVTFVKDPDEYRRLLRHHVEHAARYRRHWPSAAN